MSVYLLVHGGFRGAWSWDGVGRALRALGHTVIAPDFPGMGARAHELSADQNVESYADALEDAVAHVSGELTVVAHSFGGLPATLFADRRAGRVSRIVYLDAVVPRDGASNADLFPASVPAWAASVGADGWQVPPPPVEVLGLADRSRELVRSRLTPMPLAAFLQRIRLSGGNEPVARREFVLATGWAANPYRSQALALAADPSWRVAEVACGHDVMLDAPEWTVALLSEG